MANKLKFKVGDKVTLVIPASKGIYFYKRLLRKATPRKEIEATVLFARQWKSALLKKQGPYLIQFKNGREQFVKERQIKFS